MSNPNPSISQAPVQEGTQPGSGAALDVDSNMPDDGVVEIDDDDDTILDEDRERTKKA